MHHEVYDRIQMSTSMMMMYCQTNVAVVVWFVDAESNNRCHYIGVGYVCRCGW